MRIYLTGYFIIQKDLPRDLYTSKVLEDRAQD